MLFKVYLFFFSSVVAYFVQVLFWFEFTCMSHISMVITVISGQKFLLFESSVAGKS